MSGAFLELEHPADIFLEIRGDTMEQLFENSLYGLYSHVVEIGGVEPAETRELVGVGTSAAETMRSLLAEALFMFDTEGFVGASGQVKFDRADSGHMKVVARLWGEKLDPYRHLPLAEVKAITYHQLSAEQVDGEGWRATVLLDV